MDLSIIIVTYNNENEINRCLRSVFAHSEGLKTEVFVIDNASTDGTRKTIENIVIPSPSTWLRTGSARDLNASNLASRFLASDGSTTTARNDGNGALVTTIWNEKNLGFAAAVNQGMEKSTGKNILLLNPDTELTLGSLATMVKYLHDRPEVGIAGCNILNRDGSVQPSVRRFPTLFDQLVIYSKFYRLFPRLVAKYMCRNFDYEKEQAVDQVRGACFFISRGLVNRIGMMDAKNFFIWFEEVDYCKRAKDAGFAVMYVPQASVIHEGGVSFGQVLSLRKQHWLNRSMRNYFRKHGTALDVIVISAVAPFSLLLSYLVQIFKIKPKKYV